MKKPQKRTVRPIPNLAAPTSWPAHWFLSEVCTRLNATVYMRGRLGVYAGTEYGTNFVVTQIKQCPGAFMLAYLCSKDAALASGVTVSRHYSDLVRQLKTEGSGLYETPDGDFACSVLVNDDNCREVADKLVAAVLECEERT